MAPDGSDRVRAQPKILSYVLDIPNLCSLSGLACTVLALYFMPRQKNSWAVFGTGSAPSAWYKAVSAA